MSNPQRAVCTACLEDKPLADFPGTTLTRNCAHPSSLCLECVTSYINSQIQGTTPEHTRCPECEEQLDYDAIRLFANPELFNLSQRLAIDSLISKQPSFVWCPLGCGTGQVHPSGADQPLVYCLRCGRHFCFRHRAAWHSDYTCDEYDAFLANTRGFRSRAQIRREEDRAGERAYRRYRQQLDKAEARIAQSLLRTAKAKEARRRAKQRRREEERRRQAEERARRDEERRAREALEIQARIKEEERKTNRFLMSCPHCGIPNVKISGW
ncbi:hypothetical protein F4820DRAFT_443636 [Hypoxylon rubiginosum]|uniref:Uncharacterized protein n=1 Tax=Hypoxylon rubiginosum TaxID=110542 RepID=A0ACB9ZFA1_9PEZI|nr:hypothetical protein F4820DRAFT_443636 [Hypoxylon rubiginosum]